MRVKFSPLWHWVTIAGQACQGGSAWFRSGKVSPWQSRRGGGGWWARWRAGTQGNRWPQRTCKEEDFRLQISVWNTILAFARKVKTRDLRLLRSSASAALCSLQATITSCSSARTILTLVIHGNHLTKTKQKCAIFSYLLLPPGLVDGVPVVLLGIKAGVKRVEGVPAKQ